METPEQLHGGPTKTIDELVLEQHERQERFTYRDYTLMIMSTQQELGQLTTDLLPLFKFRTLPEKWDGAWQNWQNVQQQAVTSAVARAARFVEMGEYISSRAGWPSSPQEVIRTSLSSWKASTHDWQNPYLHIVSDTGMMAYYLADEPARCEYGMSDRIRRLVFWSFILIISIQNK